MLQKIRYFLSHCTITQFLMVISEFFLIVVIILLFILIVLFAIFGN